MAEGIFFVHGERYFGSDKGWPRKTSWTCSPVTVARTLEYPWLFLRTKINAVIFVLPFQHLRKMCSVGGQLHCEDAATDAQWRRGMRNEEY